ncbi:MAG: amidase [Rhizobiales bacterium]|nr:amidase [Hyphomicrobiales bacterium]
MGVAELTAAYRSGALSPVDVVREALDRAETVNARFNAFVSIDREGAMADARASEQRWRAGAPASRIDGVPATVKDIVAVRGQPLRAGSKATEPLPQPTDSPVVERLRSAGTPIVGLTTTPEFGFQAVTQSPLTGITSNPWDSRLTPGGSSGGAAVAAVTGAGVLHVGTDGGGSIRIPAAFTGTAGLKPSYGRVPAYPPSPFGTLSHLGPMARNVSDAREMIRVMAGRDARDWHQQPGDLPSITDRSFRFKGARVGLWTAPACGGVDPELAAACGRAYRLIEAAGAVIEAIALPSFPLLEMFTTHWYAGAAARLAAIKPERREACDPEFLLIAGEGAALSAQDYCSMAAMRAEFGRQMELLFSAYDVVVSPATPIAAFPTGTQAPADAGYRRWTDWAGFSFPLNLSQQPACVVPCGMISGNRPVALQFAAPRGRDHVALSAAAAFEAKAGELEK